VLIIEKDTELGNKFCAMGVTDDDIVFIPESEYNFPLSPIYVSYEKGEIRAPKGEGLISSIDRKKVLNKIWKKISRSSNLELSLNTKISKIDKEKSKISLDSGQEISYKFLVGADGAGSNVRRVLNLSTQKVMVAIQYITPKLYDKFEFFLDNNLFKFGYAWIFPNKEFTSIGCALDHKSPHLNKMKENLDLWIKNTKTEILDAKLQAFFINYDYQGYKFENIFLIGDAGGFASGLAGKGMFGACASGKQVGLEILGKQSDLINKWLEKKNLQDSLIYSEENYYVKKFTK